MSAELTAAAPPQPSSPSSSSSSDSSDSSSSSEDERERKKRRRREKRKKEKKEKKRRKRKKEKKRRKKRKKEKHERRKRRKHGVALAASEGGGVGPPSGAGQVTEGGEEVPEDSSERHRRNWEARHRARERERAEQLQWQQRQQRTMDEIAPKPEAGRCVRRHPCCAAAVCFNPGARLAVLTTGLLRSFAARLERRRDNAADAASRETGGSLELGDNDIFGDGGYF